VSAIFSVKRKKKDKFFLILLFFFLVIFIISKSLIKVADAASVSGKLRVPPPFAVQLSVLIDNEICPVRSYCLGDIVKITNKLENVGYTNITGNLSTSIFNTTNQIIHNKKWSNIDLTVGKIEYLNTNYTIQGKEERGTYNIKSNFTYYGNLTELTCSFEVKKDIGILQRFVFPPFPPDKIVDTLQPGRTNIYPSAIQFLIDKACNSTTAILNKTIGIPAEWISLSQDEIYLFPDSPNSTDVNITIPSNIPEGVYDNGTIFAYVFSNGGYQTVQIGLNITVSYNDFLMKVTVPNENKRICQGGHVNAIINLTKIYPPGEVNANLTYQILYNNWTVYSEKTDYNLSIIDNETIIPYSMVVPPSTGDYIFLARLEKNLTLAQNYDTFEVISCPTTTELPPGISGGRKEEPQISQIYKIVLNVSDEILSVITGNKTSFIASVNNTGTDVAKSIRIVVDGVPSEWVSVFPSINNIYPGDIGRYLVVIDVPKNATPGIYNLNVKAKDDTESNTVVITLIIGRNPKEIADLLLTEVDRVKTEAERSLLVKNCIDTTVIKTIYDDAQYAVERGKEEYDKKNYAGAINWFEYAIPVEKKVVSKVDITLEMELETSNSSRIIIPPFVKSKEQFQLAGTYLEGKNYEKICDPLEKVKNYILIGLIFWPAIIIILIILIILFVIYYRIRRRRERARILMEVKQRLDRIPDVEGRA